MTSRWFRVLCLTVAVVGAVMFSASTVQAQKAKKGPPPAAALPLIVPAGTDVILRVDREIQMKHAKLGEAFPATVAFDVVSGWQPMIYRGDPAEVRLFNVEGNADQVAFRLSGVTVNKKFYPVVSDTAREYTEKDAGGTAGKVGLGGAVGVGRGAATGAGAGSGLFWSTATKDNAVIPAGALLRFTLRQSIYLR